MVVDLTLSTKYFINIFVSIFSTINVNLSPTSVIFLTHGAKTLIPSPCIVV